MQAFEEARNLLSELENDISVIRGFVDEKTRESNALLEEKLYYQKEIDKLVGDKDELDKVLGKCTVDMCPYRLSFEKVREGYKGDILELVKKRDFHFFMCYRGNYYARLESDHYREKTVVQYHKEIIDKHGFCWWAKFYKARTPDGDYEILEPFGESIRPKDFDTVGAMIRERVKERVLNGDPVYLFNYSPNPPDIELIVCNVVDFYYCEEGIPYQNDSSSSPAQCAYFPSYYMASKEDCTNCKDMDPQRCVLRFPSNFWFKIDAIQELEDVNDQFINLENCFSNDYINFAIPIFYPLLVSQKQQQRYFQQSGIFTRIEFTEDAKQVMLKSGNDERIIRVLEAIDSKGKPTPGAHVKRFKGVKDRDLWEYRFSKKGRIFVEFRNNSIAIEKLLFHT